MITNSYVITNSFPWEAQEEANLHVSQGIYARRERHLPHSWTTMNYTQKASLNIWIYNVTWKLLILNSIHCSDELKSPSSCSLSYTQNKIILLSFYPVQKANVYQPTEQPACTYASGHMSSKKQSYGKETVTKNVNNDTNYVKSLNIHSDVYWPYLYKTI